MEKCRNCGQLVIHHYCPHCGQRIERQINSRLAVSDMVNDVVKIDTPRYRTIKGLFTRPGHLIADYLNGKRVCYSRPFTLLIVVTVFFQLLENMIQPVETTIRNKNSALEIMNNPSIAFLIMLPAMALMSWLLFHKRCKYNYFEHLYIVAFISIQWQFIYFFLSTIPSIFLFQDDTLEALLLPMLPSIVLIFGFTIWDYKQLLKLSTAVLLWKITLYFLLLFIGILALVMIFGFVDSLVFS